MYLGFYFLLHIRANIVSLKKYKGNIYYVFYA